jgi:A/G-specific adenine glycosylase
VGDPILRQMSRTSRLDPPRERNQARRLGDKRAFVRRLLAWGRSNRRDFPWRARTTPFQILVAEVLLQRSRSKTVARVYENLVSRWPTPEALAKAGEGRIARVIHSLGLTSRAATLNALASSIQGRGKVPERMEDLMSLPGVGRYAAAATRTVAFGKREPIVDRVTARVYRRYFGLPHDEPASTDDRLWEKVAEVTPRSSVREWNWAVLDHAATICLPKRPRCQECPILQGCIWAAGVRVTGSV